MTVGRTIRKTIKRLEWAVILLFVWSIIGVAFFDGCGTPFYRVKREYARVLTAVCGDKRVDERVGYHWRFVSSPSHWIFYTREYSKRVEFIYLDNSRMPHDMQASDKIKFRGCGVWTYRVVDLDKFGIRMGAEAKTMLMAELNGIAKAKIQAHDVEYIVTKIDMINREINNCEDIQALEEKYGVKILSFRLTDATYPKEMNEKTAEAKGIKIRAEATRVAADNLAQAREKLADADGYRVERIIKGAGIKTEAGRQKAMEILERLNFQDMLRDRPPGENTYIFTDRGSSPNLTLPPPSKPSSSWQKQLSGKTARSGDDGLGGFSYSNYSLEK